MAAKGAGYRDNKPVDADGSYSTWWHNVVGHPGVKAAKKMIEQGYGKVNGVLVSEKQFSKADTWCDTCAKTNCRRSTHKRRKRANEGWPEHPNMLHGADTMGREKQASYWKEKYSTVIKDFHCGTTWTYAHARKSDMPAVLEDHEHQAVMDARKSKSYGDYNGTVDFNVKVYRYDNAGEFMSEYEMDRRRRNKIGTEPTVPGPGHGQQNAVAERAIGLVRKLSNKLIHRAQCTTYRLIWH